MKYDLTKKRTRGAQRTLDAFSGAMFTLVAQEAFDKINVNEICKISNFPRATFYNYFADKYDLVNYCWYLLTVKVKLNEFSFMAPEKLLFVYFDRLYDLLIQHKDLMVQITQHNDFDSPLITSFTTYLKNIIRKILYKEYDPQKNDLPAKLLADHISNTLLLLLGWIFLKNHDVSKTRAHQYLRDLLGNNCQPAS